MLGAWATQMSQVSRHGLVFKVLAVLGGNPRKKTTLTVGSDTSCTYYKYCDRIRVLYGAGGVPERERESIIAS